MNTTSKHGLVLKIMLFLNLILITYISLISAVSIVKISESMQARDFIDKFSIIPPVPWTIPVGAIGGFVILTVILYIGRCFELNEGVICIAAIILGVYISLILDMNYCGIIFLVAAYLMDYFYKDERKLIFVIILSVCLLIFDYNICSEFMHIISFNVYVEYYNNMVSSLILGFKNLGTTLNMLLFIVYTILLLGEQIDENEKINELNEKLNIANEELVFANEELEKFALESQKTAQTKERNRLAREIHDTLGHTLTGIMAGLDAAIAILPISTEETKKQLEIIRDVAKRGMTDVRRSVHELRPDVLEHEDLLYAINSSIDEMTKASNVDIVFNNSINQLRFNEDEEDVIYRIIQESITNSIRHGKAKKVTIYMKKEYSIVSIIIHDDGCGSKDIKYGFGLTHMQERLDMLKGTLQVYSDEGFTVVAKIPIRWGEDND